MCVVLVSESLSVCVCCVFVLVSRVSECVVCVVLVSESLSVCGL